MGHRDRWRGGGSHSAGHTINPPLPTIYYRAALRTAKKNCRHAARWTLISNQHAMPHNFCLFITRCFARENSISLNFLQTMSFLCSKSNVRKQTVCDFARQPAFLQTPQESITGDAEITRGHTFIAGKLLQTLAYYFQIERFQIKPSLRQIQSAKVSAPYCAHGLCLRPRVRQTAAVLMQKINVLRQQNFPITGQYGSLDDIFQFPDITRPGVLLQELQGLRMYGFESLFLAFGFPVQNMAMSGGRSSTRSRRGGMTI